MTQERFARQLAALDQLEPDATPTEQDYYRSLREKYAKTPARAPVSEPGEETLTSRAADIDEGHEALHYWQYELMKPDLDPIWKGWLEEKFTERQNILNQMIGELIKDGYDYQAPPFDLEKQKRINELDRLQSRAAGLKDLILLKQAWAERNNRTEELESIIEPYSSELREIQAKLKDLE